MYIFELEHYVLYLYGEKVCICELSEVCKSQKSLGPRIVNQQSFTFAEGPQMLQII
jgi:hypothetical protein